MQMRSHQSKVFKSSPCSQSASVTEGADSRSVSPQPSHHMVGLFPGGVEAQIHRSQRHANISLEFGQLTTHQKTMPPKKDKPSKSVSEAEEVDPPSSTLVSSIMEAMDKKLTTLKNDLVTLHKEEITSVKELFTTKLEETKTSFCMDVTYLDNAKALVEEVQVL